ncbi:HAD family hydrolase [Streptomyces avicenniae]|uniref:HAD family hydrolase n=1 Tax=Streptomyces avicenniae TaxID=500153 RepID=UPI00069C6E22|nr:HAD family hydrolase [Streptomyces avicenniae]
MAAPIRTDRRPHIVWDWNGTLLHDTDIVLAATNAAFGELGLAPLTLDGYRDAYTLPLPVFYERLLGRAPTAEEWEVTERVFQRRYLALAAGAVLADGAAELLAGWNAAGRTQSVCSLAAHDHLVPLLGRYGIDHYFLRVDGNATGQPAPGKAEQMARHLAALDGVLAQDAVVVGDATDDAVAAAHAGAKAVLYTGGSHSRRSLLTAGVPVVDTLAEALEVAEELVGRPLEQTL